MDMLHTGTFFEPQLRFAVGAAHIPMGTKIAHLHILALEKVDHRGIDVDELAVFVQAAVDVLRKRTQHHQHQQHEDHHHQDDVPHKDIDKKQDAGDDQDKVVELIVAVTILHEFEYFFEKILHVIHHSKDYHKGAVISSRKTKMAIEYY